MNFFYERAGEGENAVLCLPGSLGTTRTDFEPQLKSDLLTRNHTVIALDPRGYGRSRPPARKFGLDFHHLDAKDGFAVMRSLGYNQFSVLGWSSGANSAVIMAANEPDAVRKIVIWGAHAFISEDDMKANQATIDSLSKRHRETMETVYGPSGLRELWASLQNAVDEIVSHGGNLYKEEVGKVICPTFLLYGAKDPIVPRLHVDFLQKNLKCTLRYHEFPEGKHNIHLRYADAFNQMVANFLSE